MKTIVTVLGAMALASTLAMAEEKPAAPPEGGRKPGAEGRRERPNPEEAFKKLDANSDGSVTAEEFKAGPRAQQNPERAEAAFKRMDKDSDGKLSLEEFKTRPQRPPGGGREGGRRGGAEGEKKAE